jgi:hypothetical protein
MIFIDPSELRQISNLRKHISNVVYEPLPDLEAITGADVMISPDGLPSPFTENLLKHHIDCGAKLIQLKFGHDLPQSIMDGRLNEALLRMLKTGANSWQCLLLFVGLFSYDSINGKLMINGQLTYGNPMKWEDAESALVFWSERGGTLDFPLPSGNLIHKLFTIHQDHINRFRDGEIERILWPKAPAFYDEIEYSNPYLKKWGVAQKLVVVEDIRPMICSIPGVRIGPAKATAILDYMAGQGIRQDWNGFESIVNDKSILNVSGIGKELLSNIESGLFETLEERNRSK